MEQILVLLTSETEAMAIEEILQVDFDVTLCSDPIEAAMNLQRDYDAMILDLFLPGDDGLTFLAQNRNQCPSVIILLSQLICSDVLTQAKAIGVNVIIRKPCDISVIRKHLVRLLAEKNPSRVNGRGMESQEDTPVWTTQKSTPELRINEDQE